jgi:uncharacterized protein
MKTRNLVTAMAVGAIGVVALAAPAFAHVEIDPPEAAQGSTTTITFHVPNEETASDTVKVDVKLPDDHPIATATALPVEGGWTAEIIKSSSGNVSEVVWTGGKLGPGAELELGLTVGPLPTDATELTFPTIQTYSDGTEVAWIEPTPASGVEPEHPMPTLKLTAAPAGSSTSSSAVSTTTAPSSSSTSTSSSAVSTTTAPVTAAVKKDDDSKLPLIFAVVVVLALVVGVGAYARSRRA